MGIFILVDVNFDRQLKMRYFAMSDTIPWFRNSNCSCEQVLIMSFIVLGSSINLADCIFLCSDRVA